MVPFVVADILDAQDWTPFEERYASTGRAPSLLNNALGCEQHFCTKVAAPLVHARPGDAESGVTPEDEARLAVVRDHGSASLHHIYS